MHKQYTRSTKSFFKTCLTTNLFFNTNAFQVTFINFQLVEGNPVRNADVLGDKSIFNWTFKSNAFERLLSLDSCMKIFEAVKLHEWFKIEKVDPLGIQ